MVNEKTDLEHFKKFFDGNVININGVTDLLTTAAILKRAELFIGNDSGLGHIASAVKTKTFTIFGPGEPNRYRPWGAESYWYQNNEKDISKIKPAVIFQSIIKNLGLAAEKK
jgi:ADP-heptose:LPS heptosyltransferase